MTEQRSESGTVAYSDSGKYVEILDDGYWGFSEPFRMSWFLSVVGAEYFHVYLWIAKDLSWTQEFKSLSLFFGTLATLWCVVIFFHAFRAGNSDEVYSTVALFMWIFANYWWMTGEVHDDNYPNEESIYTERANESAWILTAAVCYLSVYYFIIIPFNLMPVSAEAIATYDDGSLKPRFAFLNTFRQYENLHMYFWIIKDLSWNREFITFWFIMLVPALFLAGDFCFISAFQKNSLVDTVHYATIFLWVCGNVTWALGEFFFVEYDEPIRLWHGSAEARKTARWYSSWILFVSLWPVVALYCIWIPLTLMGRLDPSNDPLSFSKDYRDGDGAGDMLLPRPFKTDIDIALEEGNTEKSQKNISKVRSYPPSYNVQEKCITTHRKSRISSTVRSDVITNIISSESEDVTDALTNTTAAYSG